VYRSVKKNLEETRNLCINNCLIAFRMYYAQVQIQVLCLLLGRQTRQLMFVFNVLTLMVTSKTTAEAMNHVAT